MIRRVLVVFCDNSGVWWLKGLKKGFRHCFVIAEVQGDLIMLDPTFRNFQVDVLKHTDLLSLKKWYQDKGFHVVHWIPEGGAPQIFSWAPFTCVEVIKRVLGIYKMMILTPWQLYKHLKNKK